MTTVHKESTLESAIVLSLCSPASPAREQPGAYGGVLPPDSGYRQREPKHYDPALCLDPELVFDFLAVTQRKEWEKLCDIHGDEVKPKFLRRLTQEIERRGALNVLRDGIKDHGCRFDLAYFAPASGLNPEHAMLYGSNILSIIRQLPINPDADGTVDLGLFLNGILVATAELKHHMTSQTVRHAMAQYRARNLREPVFRLPVAHFAVDNDLVYVTTKVAGDATRFLPFNKGHDQGAGNPPNPDGFRSQYLWTEIWPRDSWLEILGHFIHEQQVENEETGKRERNLIFPRYHQLDAVRRLLADARENGVGRRYLVQHSAGSGKSNTIAWMVHRLSNLHDRNSKRVFDTIIVITDRRVLDRQLRNVIKDFEKVAGVVVGVTEGSKQLKEALEGGKQIVVTTVQKFPFICEEIEDLPGKRFAIVIDEAHSGQSGSTQRALSKTLNAKTLKEAEEADAAAGQELIDDEILRELGRTGLLANASYFAFTATPKAKTLEMFGEKRPDGKFEAFSLYTMKQAIEEGFILDVLENYTTYATYFSLLKRIEEDPEYPKKEAVAVMLRYADLHEHAIEQKAGLMIEHFHTNVRHRVGGKAKAMVVTRSRLHAVRYKQAFDKLLAERRLPYKALVAFSGEVNDEERGAKFTEPRMNGGISEKQTAEEFKKPECRFLICAEKFQTGFDQPLLHTMYVDKKLTGLNAVQTLSRLNRTHPQKEGTFVLDFANTADEIEKAFEPYYRATVLSEATDPNKLYDLQTQIGDHCFFDAADIEAFAEVFWDSKLTDAAKLPKLHSLLDPVVERYQAASEEERSAFKRTAEQFVRLYAFLSQIMPFQDIDLEKWFQYLRLLRGKLPATRKSLPIEVIEQIGLNEWKIVRTGQHEITLEGESEVKPPDEVGTGLPTESELEPLSVIIATMNETFGTQFDEGDRVMIAEVQRRVLHNENLRDAVLNNPKDAVRVLFDPLFEDALNELIDDNLGFYKKVMDNDDIKKELRRALFESVYKRLIAPE